MQKISGVIGVLIYSHDNRKQLEEIKRLLLKNNLFSVSKKIKFSTIKKFRNKKQTYRLMKVANNYVTYSFAMFTIATIDLTVVDLKYFNAKAETMFETDSIYGLKDEEGLEGVLAMCNQFAFGREYHPTVIDKTAYLWYTLARKQLFHNGNKRTAILASLTFLHLNFIGFKNIDGDELYALTVKIAEGKITQVELKAYIIKNSVLNFRRMNEYNESARLYSFSE
ncbi:type II toxin-antitoxin system death-on-curing family toxin [Fructobacillus sp. M2-14]|uniref:Type II toxin-antitoxin system death-on-curing family toxin n=1 Tax=Fructobacillus broussonetiae TaxID=2713173 RepID=A0ABS5QZA1_9LACO|nr:type II toxin-antitoxin system death-on-curing family toxin [Fructobacillus broussonetiae]MBS9338530.1 type II toxin-antitoxin system death-on-curing family toxin [Fructobacillus broussonetiae]